jgi:hypothetical protein
MPFADAAELAPAWTNQQELSHVLNRNVSAQP